jgi:hypothetical protein
MKWVYTGFFLMLAAGLPHERAEAQGPISIATELVTKVVRAIDLVVQRLQTQTILLQEAQKEVENAMSELQLDDIAEWVQDQKDLYGEYFAELAQVKTVIAGYHKAQEIVEREQQILSAYQRGMAVFGKDPHFSAAELNQITAVYGGILAESERNLSALTTVISAFTTQMSDQQRMAIIDKAGAGMDRTWRDIQAFTNENALLSLQRASEAADDETLKKLYGL